MLLTCSLICLSDCRAGIATICMLICKELAWFLLVPPDDKVAPPRLDQHFNAVHAAQTC